MRKVLSCITSLLIITAAVSRRVSLRTLSAEWKGQQSGGCQTGVIVGYISSAPGSHLESYKRLYEYV